MKDKLQRELLARWRRNRSTLIGVALHGLTIIAFIAMFTTLQRWLPADLPSHEFENSVQLLGQVLALVVGVLLLGTTVSLSSYDGSDTLAAIHSELTASTEPLFIRFFVGGSERHKLDRREFRRWLLLRPHVKKLLFSEFKGGERGEDWFIYRPNWDGAWYRVAESPFNHTNRNTHQLAQVQALHEIVICANTVLKVVADFRASGSALLGREKGSNGTRWFLEAFERYQSEEKLQLPAEMDLNQAVATLSLALNSEHYMQEEFHGHAENIDWGPFVLTTFQLTYAEYVKSLIHLIVKLQLLRLENLATRHPSGVSSHVERIEDALWLPKLAEVQRNLEGLRSKIVAAHGAAKYFYSIKQWSIPGIGGSLLVLVALLCGWPFLKWVVGTEARTLGFTVLYSAGIASLVESSIFLARLLWKRRTAG